MEMESKLKANLNILLRMVTSLYTADVQLNPGKEAKRCLIVYNKENGILIVDGGLFSLSLYSFTKINKNNIVIEYGLA